MRAQGGCANSPAGCLQNKLRIVTALHERTHMQYNDRATGAGRETVRRRRRRCAVNHRAHIHENVRCVRTRAICTNTNPLCARRKTYLKQVKMENAAPNGRGPMLSVSDDAHYMN